MLGVFQQRLVYAVDKRICIEIAESLSALMASMVNPGTADQQLGHSRRVFAPVSAQRRAGEADRDFSPRIVSDGDAQCAVPTAATELACFKFHTFRLIHRFTLQAAAAK